MFRFISVSFQRRIPRSQVTQVQSLLVESLKKHPHVSTVSHGGLVQRLEVTIAKEGPRIDQPVEVLVPTYGPIEDIDSSQLVPATNNVVTSYYE